MQIAYNKNSVSLTSTVSAGTAYVHAIQKVTFASTTFVTSTITGSTSTYSFTTDGYYVLTEIPISTNPTGTYYTDMSVIYDSNGDEVDIEDLLEEEITMTSYNYLLFYFLETYYINLIKSKFLKSICGCGCTSSKEKLTIDTLTMGIDVLRILQTYEQFIEASRIIDQLSVCTGIVNPNCSCYD